MKKGPEISSILMSSQKSTGEFASVTISFLIHSTEDEHRLLVQASGALGIPPNSIEIEVLEGHFGNTLLSALAHITGREANIVSKLIFSRLESKSKENILSGLEKNIDEHDSLYFRLDRQLLGIGLFLGSEEPIRIKLKPKNRFSNRKTIRRVYRELLEP